MPKKLSKATKARAPRKAAEAASPRVVRERSSAAAKPAARKKSAAKRPRKGRTERGANGIAALALEVLDELKAQEVRTLDVRHLTSVTDTMIFAAGRSDRHVRAIADALLERCKAEGIRPLGVEGQDAGEWVLVDLADAVVHVMLPRVREFYNIESLWDMAAREAADQ